MAKWQWGSVNIYGTNNYEISREVKRAELFVLDATSSTFHYFGAGSRKLKIKGMVIGETDRASVEADAANNISRTVTTPWNTTANCYINGTPKFTANKYAGATIEGVNYVANVTPIYDCELDIITT